MLMREERELPSLFLSVELPLVRRPRFRPHVVAVVVVSPFLCFIC